MDLQFSCSRTLNDKAHDLRTDAAPEEPLVAEKDAETSTEEAHFLLEPDGADVAAVRAISTTEALLRDSGSRE